MPEQPKKISKKKYYDNISVGARTKQIVYLVQKHDKAYMFEQFLKNSDKKQTVVIARSKRSANELGVYLEAHDIKAVVVHGNHRKADLEEASRAFNASKLNILITTDMILKPLGLTNIQVMANYELPTHEEDYFMRIRYVDEIGESISFVTPEEEKTLRTIEIMMRMDIPQEKVQGFVTTTPNQTEKPAKDKKKKPRHGKKKTQNKSEKEID
ncbi:helicase-related protein [Sulfurimonas sp.]|uniref:helicase-related protein n=1 Tax=Sulfurimonas sp. TaxID=2022749 RepID=UPI00356B2680